MKITLVSHASMIIEASGIRLWTDPWLHGKVFNESWSLLAPPAYDASMLESIDYIWISHEHPDHFHIPTLRALPETFKQRVTILYQYNNSEKMFEAMRRLGYPRHQTLPHRKLVLLSNQTSVYCYQVGQMDSVLGVRSGRQVVLDVNDAEINTRDCHLIRADLGAIDVVLNQFSIAGYTGQSDCNTHLSALAKRILHSISDNHRDLAARVTIPMASFIYFSKADNAYVNRFVNTPRDVWTHCQVRHEAVVILYNGDTYEVGMPHDSSQALVQWDAVYQQLDQRPIDPIDTVPLEQIEQVFHERAADLLEKFPRLLLTWLHPVIVRISDLNKTVRFSVANQSFEVIDDPTPPDLEMNSQPLAFGFQTPFGVQTLGVSARFRVLRNERNWRWHRIVFALNNAELYLHPKYLFTLRNMRYVTSRLRGSLNQLTYQLQRMR
jgi:UDP-MurNAc hydroxylase